MADIYARGVLTTNQTLSGTFTTLDGVILADNDLVLATAQTVNTQNGYWRVKSAGAWERPTDLGIDFFPGMTCKILEGTSHSWSEWGLHTLGTIVVDTSSQNWVKEEPGSIFTFSGGLQAIGSAVTDAPSGATASTYAYPSSITVGSGGRIAGITAGSAGTTYVEGLGFAYVSATQVQIKTGAAYIPSIQRVIELGTDTTTNVLTGNDTISYLYLYETNGAGQIEVSSTAPGTTAYFGTARYKFGDSSRRFIGYVKNDASGNLIPWTREVLGGAMVKVMYSLQDDSTTLRIVNGFTGATTRQTVDVSDLSATAALRLVAPGTMSCFVRWVTTGSGAKYIGYVPSTISPNRVLPAASVGRDWVDLSETSTLYYQLATSADTLSLFLGGYILRR